MKFIEDYKEYFIFLLFVLYFALIRNLSFNTRFVVTFLDVMFCVLFFSYITYIYEVERAKNNTNRLIYIGGSTTISVDPTPFHEKELDFLIFRCGGYNSKILGCIKGNFTIVVPRVFCINMANGWTINSMPMLTERNQLSSRLKNVLSRNDFIGDIYYALVPSIKLGINTDVSDFSGYLQEIESLYKAKDSIINELMAIIDNKMDYTRNMINFAGSTANMFNGTPQYLPNKNDGVEKR